MTTVWTDMGSIQNFDITPNPTVIDHKIARGGLKRVDETAMTLLQMEFATKIDEWTLDNMMIALLGQINTAGLIEIGVTSIKRQLKFEGDNIYGSQWEIILPNVFIAAKETIAVMGSDDFAELPLSGRILYDNGIGSFGTARPLSGATGGAPIALTPSTLNYYIGTGILSSAPIGT